MLLELIRPSNVAARKFNTTLSLLVFNGFLYSSPRARMFPTLQFSSLFYYGAAHVKPVDLPLFDRPAAIINASEISEANSSEMIIHLECSQRIKMRFRLKEYFSPK